MCENNWVRRIAGVRGVDLGTEHFSMQPLDCGMDFRLAFIVQILNSFKKSLKTILFKDAYNM